MNGQIVFTKKNVAEFIESEDVHASDDAIVVKTEVSSISAGTERANLTGDPNVSWLSDSAVNFPRYCGYSSAGIVTETGKNVTDVKVGDRVAVSWSLHRQYNYVPKGNYVKIPDGVSVENAALCHIATFPLAAIRKTRLETGENVLITGLGVLGLIAVKLARIAGGVPVMAADPVEARRNKALRFGADAAFDPAAEDFAERVKEFSCGGANVAVEVTGNGAGLNETLDCMQRFGRVALLGCTRDKNFVVDYYRKVHGPGITLVGAHTMARPDTQSSPGMFTQRDDMLSLLKLMRGGRLDFSGEIDETHSPNDCAAVYERLINEKNFPALVQFDWRKI